MVYAWDAHRAICHRLYAVEKRSLESIIEYLRLNHNFTPSKRALLSHFRQWQFPSKQNPAYKNEALVRRIQELWEKNVVQKEMLRILLDEGFDVSMRELSRVRTKNRWLLREPTETRNQKTQPPPARPPGPSPGPDLSGGMIPAAAAAADAGGGGGGVMRDGDAAGDGEPEEVRRARMEERKRALALESAEKWAAKKRRRRTRDYAGLPADPPGPPRFPSETTLEESKVILALGSELYKELRQRFQRICEEEGVSKKTLVGAEKWEAVKEQLVREMPHLRSLLWDEERMEPKKLAIDVICVDVTKRMRMAGRRWTLADAKNVLGLNPEESRETRFAFYRILAADRFVGKLESGTEHWDELKEKWLAESGLLQGVLASGAGPSREDRLRAIDILARDVRKRYRDDIHRADPRHNQARHLPAAVMPAGSDLSPIDPDLATPLFAAAGGQQPRQQCIQPQYAPAHAPQQAQPQAEPGRTLAVYFRLHPASTAPGAPAMWISTLGSRSFEELRAAAVAKLPGAECVAIDGLVRDGKGGEVPLQVQGDSELEAYLAHVQEVQGSPSFSVQLAAAAGRCRDAWGLAGRTGSPGVVAPAV